ncbi:MAG: carbon storage regulator [Pirellulales bacterium]
MLVLSRKVGERIHVGDDIVLEVRRISGNRVTLALEAPREVRILRGELEHAAREFKTPPNPQPACPPDAATTACLTVIDHLTTPAVSRDFAI